MKNILKLIVVTALILGGVSISGKVATVMMAQAQIEKTLANMEKQGKEIKSKVKAIEDKVNDLKKKIKSFRFEKDPLKW